MINTELFTICHPRKLPPFSGIRYHFFATDDPNPRHTQRARDLHSRGHLSKKQRYR